MNGLYAYLLLYIVYTDDSGKPSISYREKAVLLFLTTSMKTVHVCIRTLLLGMGKYTRVRV